MTKPFQQITFDFFNDNPEQETTPADIPVVEPPKEEVIIAKEEPVVEVETEKRKSTRGRRKLTEMGLEPAMLRVPADDVLFQKQYYSMSEVAAMFRENQSLIRYWETEFDILQPRKNGKGDRFFRPVDVKNLVMIYDLLRRRKFTIEGAKEYLKKNKKAEEKFAMIQSLEKIRSFLLELKASL